MAGVIVEDIFHVKDIDPEGKQFDGVSRLHCESESYKMDMILDANTCVYPIDLGETFSVCFAKTLREDGYPDNGEPQFEECGNLADKFEYVMHGKVYRMEGQESANDLTSPIATYASFGGLLMRLRGDVNHFSLFEVGMSLYILMKRVEV